MIRIILFLVIGLVSWLMLTSHQQIRAIFESTVSNPEVVTLENDIEAPQTNSNEFDESEKVTLSTSEVAEFTNPTADEVNEENVLLLAENNVTKTDIDSFHSAESDAEKSNEIQVLEEDLDNEDSLQSEINAAENVALAEEDEKLETNATDLDADRDLEVEAKVKEPESAAAPSEAEELDDVKTTAASTPMAMPPMNPYMYNMWMPSMQTNAYNPWMNPLYNMMMPMMSMMGTMMNPAMYMNPMTMMNYPVTTMTQPQNMDAMMKSMDPQLMFGMFGQPSTSYREGNVPDQLPVVTIPGFPTQTYQNWPRNMPSESVSREAKMNAFQTAMAMSPLSMRNMVSMMADKIPVAEDVSWDDAVEAMKLRANEINFKFVGSSPLWKQIEAETEEPSTKVEIFRFCDARVARKILDEVPEFIVFLPCRIALLEDAEGKLWVMTLDWDVSWLDYAQNQNTHLPKDLREDAKRVRESIAYIMEGAATGDF